MSRFDFRRLNARHPYLLALLLLALALAVNYLLQPNLFQSRVLNSNMRTFLPLMILAAGQTIVIITGGIDLSVGAIVSLAAAVLVTNLSPDAAAGQIALIVLAAAGVGMAAGALNGFCVAFLRLQPIVTTYATSFIFSGLALWILPRPGGSMPQQLARTYRSAAPLGLPLGIYIAILLIIGWTFLRSTRFGTYLVAVGGRPDAAYASGVPVTWVRFASYVLAGLLAAFSALALTLLTSSGDPRMGDAMTLDSIVAVVLGGTRLSGGQGGVAGSIIGVAILGLIRNIISFANVPTWWQTLVDALIIITALAAPGLVRLLRSRRQA
ncbi:MAG: ABC transporter permease [Caldilineaceae bacterium]|nr:ABC transporter permease [Caldilineaceae bacterium]MCB9138889.1 ABC transporter permease [Caldilineaceae bacterium]